MGVAVVRAVLSSYGSRGDVAPMVALAAALRDRGAEAVVCAPPDEEFVALTGRAGVAMVPAGRPLRTWAREVAVVPGAPPQDRMTQLAAAAVGPQYDAVAAAAEGADVIVGTVLFSALAARTVADQRGIPYVSVRFQPTTLPSPYHPPHALPGNPLPPGESDNRVLWRHYARTQTALFGGVVGELRARIGLPPVDDIQHYLLGDRPWLAADPLLAPWRPAAGYEVVQTGAWLLPDDRPLPAGLEAFLAAGEPPLYAGFGSMPSPDDFARTVVATARGLGRRLLVSGGWAGLAVPDELLAGGEDILAVGDVDHQALFPRVAAVVHHGGAGTTTTAARAGVPQLILPQVGPDQSYWGGRVAELGIGVRHPHQAPTVASLTGALGTVLSPAVGRAAADLGGRIVTDGAVVAAALVDEAGRTA